MPPVAKWAQPLLWPQRSVPLVFHRRRLVSVTAIDVVAENAPPAHRHSGTSACAVGDGVPEERSHRSWCWGGMVQNIANISAWAAAMAIIRGYRRCMAQCTREHCSCIDLVVAQRRCCLSGNAVTGFRSSAALLAAVAASRS